MPAFDTLQRASFASIEFPITEVTISGGIREHIHEYPHADGGAPEKLGRKLYEIRVKALFHNTFRRYGAELWPKRLDDLRRYFEIQTTEDLVVPTVGTIPAYAVTWTETATARRRSGVDVELVFREDQANAYLVEKLVNPGPDRLGEVHQQLVLIQQVHEQDLAAGVVPPQGDEAQVKDLFTAIGDAVNDVLAMRDQVELAGDVSAAKADRLVGLCEQLVGTRTLAQPRNEPLREATHEVWSAADERRRDLARRRRQLIHYETPLPLMSVTDVSRAVYGTTSRAVQVLQLNPLRDPFAIPRGTLLRLYRPDARAA